MLGQYAVARDPDGEVVSTYLVAVDAEGRQVLITLRAEVVGLTRVELEVAWVVACARTLPALPPWRAPTSRAAPASTSSRSRCANGSTPSAGAVGSAAHRPPGAALGRREHDGGHPVNAVAAYPALAVRPGSSAGGCRAPRGPGGLGPGVHGHGTTGLFAALNVADGTVISSTHRRHRAVEFKKFLAKIEETMSPRVWRRTWSATTTPPGSTRSNASSLSLDPPM